MCVWHWFMLPSKLRHDVLAVYRAGQEEDKRPSPEYLAAAKAAVDWIAALERQRRLGVMKANERAQGR